MVNKKPLLPLLLPPLHLSMTAHRRGTLIVVEIRKMSRRVDCGSLPSLRIKHCISCRPESCQIRQQLRILLPFLLVLRQHPCLPTPLQLPQFLTHFFLLLSCFLDRQTRYECFGKIGGCDTNWLSEGSCEAWNKAKGCAEERKTGMVWKGS